MGEMIYKREKSAVIAAVFSPNTKESKIASKAESGVRPLMKLSNILNLESLDIGFLIRFPSAFLTVFRRYGIT